MASVKIGALSAAIIVGPEPSASAEGAPIAFDSRAIAPGALFIAVRGEKADGADYVAQAVAAGAVGVVTDLAGALRIRERLGVWPVPIYIVADPRQTAARLARAAWPQQPETLVAVTGTNGKTSVASFAAQIFGALGKPAASFGTVGVESFGLTPTIAEPLSHTTLEATALHRLLQRLSAAGVTHAAMEASSHGLAQRRLDGVDLAAAALTNITRDHLDYHLDAPDYWAAKLRLFAELAPTGATAVLNADDASFEAARAVALARGLAVLPVGRAAAGARAITIKDAVADEGGLSIRYLFEGVAYGAQLQLVGAFQAENALIAAGLAIGAGLPAAAVFASLEQVKGVRGRMELASRRASGAGVFVDYAHTPDALRVALAALRPHTAGRLHVVFGAGGDRDPGKRPLMGAAAAAGADRVIVTDDNPRSEDPAAIRAAILAAAPDAIEVGDRAEAILRAIEGMAAGDALLIAGKGHEQGQTVAGETLPFDDVEQARAATVALDGCNAQLFER